MFRLLLDLLFPPTPREQLLARCESLTPTPRSADTPAGVRVLSCAQYRHPDVQAAILTLKAQKDARATTLLATLLADVLTEEAADATLWNERTLIVPMPLSRARERERGFNQVAHVCGALPKELTSLVRTDVLERTQNTPPQKTLSRRERLTSVSGAFAAPHPREVEDCHIILVDDVVTTGATLAAAANTLTRAGAQVKCVALARV